MESSNGSSIFTYTSSQTAAVSPFSYLHVSSSSYPRSSDFVAASKANSKPMTDDNYHQRCSSENFVIMEDQPSWLDDLLSETETVGVHRGHHRRSASDTYAISEAAAAAVPFWANKEDSEKTVSISSSSIWDSPRFSRNNNSSDSKSTSSDEYFSKGLKESFEAMRLPMGKRGKEEPNMQNAEGCSKQINSGIAKTPATKTELKRAKQQSAHRSRVRKLKYIAELERTVQLLQAEGSEVQAELEFLNQQNVILSMENRALRQRLDSLSQEQLIKHIEQEMLERELVRLQTHYQLQTQQQMQMQMQMQHQMQQQSKHRQTKSRDLEPQFTNLSLKNKDVSSGRGSASKSVRI